MNPEDNKSEVSDAIAAAVSELEKESEKLAVEVLTPLASHMMSVPVKTELTAAQKKRRAKTRQQRKSRKRNRKK